MVARATGTVVASANTPVTAVSQDSPAVSAANADYLQPTDEILLSLADTAGERASRASWWASCGGMWREYYGARPIATFLAIAD